MTKQQRLWQKRRKNKVVTKKFLLVRNQISPREQKGALLRLPGSSARSPCWKGSAVSLLQQAYWCSQTRSSLGLSGKRKKDEANREWKLIKHWSSSVFVQICFRKKQKTAHKSKQNRGVLVTPSLSCPLVRITVSNVLTMSTLLTITLRVTTANFISCLLQGHWGKNWQVGDFSKCFLVELVANSGLCTYTDSRNCLDNGPQGQLQRNWNGRLCRKMT